MALYDGWAVRRYTPSGGFDRSIRLPVARVTSCAFGGPDLCDLYVTSAADGLSAAELAEQPLAGEPLRHPAGQAGLPITPFAA